MCAKQIIYDEILGKVTNQKGSHQDMMQLPSLEG